MDGWETIFLKNLIKCLGGTELMFKQLMEVLKKLKSTEKTKGIPVIMFSNLPDKTVIDQAMENGASRYALKSDYLPRAFIDLVKEVLAEKAGTDSAEDTVSRKS